MAIPGDSHRQDGVQGRKGVLAADYLCLLVRKIFQKLPFLPKHNSTYILLARAVSQAQTKPITDKK